MSTALAAETLDPKLDHVQRDLVEDSDLAFAGVARQAELVRSGEISSRELVEYQLKRIEKLNPILNAFRTVFTEQAVVDADKAQKRLDSDDDAPLLGVPIAVKDDTDVAGISTMHGTGDDHGPASEDASVVRRLREAGAIIIGKTNLSEFGALPITESATWGVTRNPWNLERTPGGSSGGTAAAVASGCVAAGLGSDGGGSIRIPSACCHLFGLKAQRGTVSIKQAPEHGNDWNGVPHIGPLTRSVEDSAIIHDAIIGEDPGHTIPSPPPTESFTEAARTTPPKLRIAISFKTYVPVPRVPVPVRDEVREPVYRMADLLRSLGHEVVERDVDYGLSGPGLLALMLNGMKRELGSNYKISRLERRTQASWRLSRRVGTEAARKWAFALQRKVTERVDEAFKEIDILITPVIAKKPIEVGSWEGRGTNSTFIRTLGFMPFTPVQNFTGQPAASIPAGIDEDGLPLSVHLVGRTNDEPTLISLAAQIEREQPWAHLRPPVS